MRPEERAKNLLYSRPLGLYVLEGMRIKDFPRGRPENFIFLCTA